MDLNLRDKVAIVTGGGSGIGRGMASGVEDEIGVKFSDTTCLASEADVSCEKSVKHLVQQAVDRFGAVNILANNVGVTLLSLIEEVKEKDMKTTMDVNINNSKDLKRQFDEIRTLQTEKERLERIAGIVRARDRSAVDLQYDRRGTSNQPRMISV